MTQPAPAAPLLPMAGLATQTTYTVGRGTMIAGLAWLALTTACSGAAGWYVLSKDDLAARLIARETARQYAYEDRIASLRAEVDRLASRALLDQDGVEARVDELATRQSELESRQALVAALTDTLQTGGVLPVPKPGLRARPLQPQEPVRASGVTSFAPLLPNALLPNKPMPAPEGPLLRGASETRPASWHSSEAAPEPPTRRIATALARLDGAIGATADGQIAALREMDRRLADTYRRLRGGLSELGLDTDRLAMAAGSGRGVGGPFVPLRVDPSAGPFEATLHAIQPRIATVLKLRDLAEALPLRRPMETDTELSSNFGYRVDPFTRGPAMHTGIDFRGEHGAPIRATGPGRVITAEYSGGYGNMVEIAHAAGVTTRYAHLSAIGVFVGQSVTTGTLLGRVGSTGRSTGPHLHYETRIDDEPVDPARFLRAGARLAEKG